MSSFRLDEQETNRRFASYFKELEDRIASLERANPLTHASLEGGSIDVYDVDGSLQTVIGEQADGTTGVVHVNGPPPPTPTVPLLAPVINGVAATWDGLFADADAAPLDFSRVEVHAAATADFEPSPLTLVSTLESPRGGVFAIPTDSPVYVRFLARNLSGTGSDPSETAGPESPGKVVADDVVDGIITEVKLAEKAITEAKLALGAVGSDALANNAVTAAKILAGAVTTDKLVALGVTAEKIAALAITTDKLAALAVTADKLAANSVTATKILAGSIDATHIKAGSINADKLMIGTSGDNLVPDPSFEGPVSAARVQGVTAWSVVDGGNGTPKALQVTATNPTPLTRALDLVVLPAMPGQKVYLAVDYLASPDWVGDRVMIAVNWLAADGTWLAQSSVATTQGATVLGSWQRLSGLPTTAAPANATKAAVRLYSSNASSGTVLFDNAQAMFVTTSGFAGARAEISPLGLQLYNDDGEEAVALMTGRPNYLSLRTDGVPVATIDQEGGAGFQRLAVAESLSIAGTDLSEYLASLPRGIQAVDYQGSTRTASGTEMGFVELASDIDPTRMYRFRFVARANPSVAGGELQIRLRDGGAGSPTINSKQLMLAVHQMPLETSFTADLEHIQNGASLGAGNHRFLISFKNLYGPGGQTCTLSGEEGALGYFYIEDVGPHVVETGGYNDGGGTTAPTPQKYTKYYNAAWSGTYSRRSSYNSYYGNTCMQGYYSSTNGTMASLIGFPSSLGSDLSGAVIIKAEVYLYFDHWYANAGGKAVIKAHSHTSRPASFSSDSDSKTVNWARNEGKWVDITSVFDSSKWRGIALDPNSTSSTFYGRARGYGQTNPPRLKVTYTK
ncbi:hypothetical protein [Streptomyces ardesiacus]|uniref:hypothetical protein n=1 Tax=Streptomyces ardesiacus TaxID=285564 RepID=UPI000D59DA1A|nr:hypothetical protein [Streptomyces ardesiacus]